MAEYWTKGPYRVDPNSNCDIQTADGKLEIASTHPNILSGGQCPEGMTPQDNARLLAASWDMAEALEMMLKHEGGDAGLHEIAKQRAKSALAKARGDA